MTIEARADAREAYRWIASKAPEDAIRWHAGLVEAISSLAWFPERCPLAPESELFGEEIRHLIHGRYRVLFRIETSRVLVPHVRHGAKTHLLEDEMDCDRPES